MNRIVFSQFATIFFIFSISFSCLYSQGDQITVGSPDGKTEVQVRLRDKIYYSVIYKNKRVVVFSPVSMTLGDGIFIGKKPVLQKENRNSVTNSIETVWGNHSVIEDNYNELSLDMKDNYSIIFRVYNDGVAYRFVTRFKGEIKVYDEEATFVFSDNHKVLFPVTGDLQSSFEKPYELINILDINETNFAYTPILVHANDGIKVAVAEADLFDYPGMYIERKGTNNRTELSGKFAAYPAKTKQGGWGDFNMRVIERADYIAKTSGTRSFPWRILVISDDDRSFASNDMVYKLARPLAIDPSWIKPGKVAWEWWNHWNLEGVDFETGVNNQTYEYYIDFASENGLEYVIMDEGWSYQFDLTLQKPNVDVPYLVQYAKERNVKIILWCVWFVLDNQLQVALDQFEKWGVAGIKVDFIDRDDQLAVNFYERVAREAAKRKLLVDYHGCMKPTGLSRMYPNVINYEGVIGNEYNKFSNTATPEHNVNIVFTRMLAGPMDYTPGAMLNSTKGNHFTNNMNPMSFGTRCHQLGMYVVYEAPLQMLCDAPTRYTKYPDILKFLSEVPVTWDETRVLEAEISEYVVIARRKGDTWYIGGLTNWTSRQLTLSLDFLGNDTFEATIFEDSINADKLPEDYKTTTKTLTSDGVLPVKMAQGGGFAVVLKKK